MSTAVLRPSQAAASLTTGPVVVRQRQAILLADEPTGNLDSRNGEAVTNLLRDLHRTGATICMVTHDARFASHAERTIHLFDGRVVDEYAVVEVGSSHVVSSDLFRSTGA